MKQAVKIDQTKNYAIWSQGNGLFITIISRQDGQEVFLQGDDAVDFDHEYQLAQWHESRYFTREDTVDNLCGEYFHG